MPDKHRAKKPRLTKGKTIAPAKPNIFGGSKFFFLPNDDIAALRKLRIKLFKDHGGEWVRKWTPDVKVIVLEHELTYDDVIKHLNVDKFPDDVNVVDDRYVSDCISLRNRPDPKNRLYWVKGAPEEQSIAPKQAEASKLPSKKRGLSRTPSPEPEKQLASAPSSVPGDKDFAEALEEAIKLNRLPINDEDTEGDEQNNQDDQVDRDWNTSTYIKTQDSFSCMHRHDGSAKNDGPNATTIQVLEEMAQYYDRTANSWRTLAYRKAASILKKKTEKIATKEAAMRIPGIGASIAEKIEEIVYHPNNKLRKLETMQEDPVDKLVVLFLGIYGVGPTQANQWIKAGYKTLQDVLEKAKLTDNQRIGIDRYDDFQKRVPRIEATQHADIVRNEVKKFDANVQITVAGSYRRGAVTSGDIDLLITKPGASGHEIATIIFDKLIPRLQQTGFLQAILSSSIGSGVSEDRNKMHGASVIPGSSIWRRIDFLIVPWEQWGAALIYFTGNDIFNRSLRLLARKKGMRLNQHGLFKNVMRDQTQKKLTEGELVESRSEQRIFSILNVPWRPPQDRNC